MTQIIKILITIIVAIYLPASMYAEVPYSTSDKGKTVTRIDVSPSEELYCMHFDRQGLLWLGTSSDIRLYDGYATHELFGNEERRFPQLGCDVRSITSDGDGNLWAGTNDGLIRLQMGTGLHRLYRFPKQSQKIIYKLFTANDGTVYVGTDDGFSVYDKNLQSTRIDIKPQTFIHNKTTIPSIQSSTQTQRNAEFTARATQLVQNHLSDSNYNRDSMAADLGMSVSSLYTRLRECTDLSIQTFIQTIRLNAACDILRNDSEIRISEVAYRVGFNTPKYFSQCFKKEFGILPGEFVKQHRNNKFNKKYTELNTD